MKFPGFLEPKTVLEIAKFQREVGRSSQYVCLPTIPNPDPLLKYIWYDRSFYS